MRLIFVRHGETRWNLEGRYQGRADIEIAPQGLATAHKVGQALQGAGFASLLTSPLRRAEQTAVVIGAALGGIPPVFDARLTEIDFGDWQGLTQQQIKQRWPQRCAAGSGRREISASRAESLSLMRLSVCAIFFIARRGRMWTAAATCWQCLTPGRSGSRGLLLSAVRLEIFVASRCTRVRCTHSNGARAASCVV